MVHAHFIWAHAHFIQTLKALPFRPSFKDSLRIPVSLKGLIPSPPFLDRNSKVLFSVEYQVLKSVHSVHSVHAVCMGLPPDAHWPAPMAYMAWTNRIEEERRRGNQIGVDVCTAIRRTIHVRYPILSDFGLLEDVCSAHMERYHQ